MSFDFLMIAVVVGGIVLSAAYVRAEYRSWREQGADERRRAAALRDLHAARLTEQQEALLPSVVQLQGFGDAEAANPDTAQDAARATSARANSPRAYPLAERRKRVRQRATRA